MPRGVYKRTLEHKAKISAISAAMTPEHKAKISASIKAAHARGDYDAAYTKERNAKVSAALMGRRLTPVHKAKVSAALTGKRFTLERKAKISAALTGKRFTPEHKAKISVGWKVAHVAWTPEQRDTMSKCAIKRLQDPNDKLGYVYCMYKGSQMRSSEELLCAQTLDKLGIKWTHEKIIIKMEIISPDGSECMCRHLPDFYLPDYNLIIEVKPYVNILYQVENHGYAFLNFRAREAKLQGYNYTFLHEHNWNSFFHNIQ